MIAWPGLHGSIHRSYCCFDGALLFWPLLVLVPRSENAYNNHTYHLPPRPPPSSSNSYPYFFPPPRHKTANLRIISKELLGVYSAWNEDYLSIFYYLPPVYCLPSIRDLSSIFSSQTPIQLRIVISLPTHRHSNNTLHQHQYDICYWSTSTKQQLPAIESALFSL